MSVRNIAEDLPYLCVDAAAVSPWLIVIREPLMTSKDDQWL